MPETAISAQNAKAQAKPRRHRGDRPDGRWLRKLDSMHLFMPYIMKSRCDNEATANPRFDMTNALAYLQKRNAENPQYKYTIFHLFIAAIAKVIALRPQLNWFISGRRLYERNHISFSFVAKKEFTDGGKESLLILKMDKDSTQSAIDQAHDKICAMVYEVRHHNKTDGTTDIMDKLVKMPRFLLNFFAWILELMDYYGNMPASLRDFDPYYSTVFISNLGSIKMDASYHHLANRGTNSFFAIINAMRKVPYFADDGTFTMRDAIELGLTIDERIADGVYFANSIRMIQRLIEEPELLDRPLLEPLPEA